MDTISLFAVYDFSDSLATQYDLLPSVPAPVGCKAWLHPLSRLVMCCCLKLQVHNVTGELNTTQSGINRMRAALDSWLGLAGLTVDDFQLSRIDYDYNFYLPAQVSEVLMDTMQQLPQRAMSMSKADFPHSVYFLCKSRHAQLYRKDKERREKGRPVCPSQEGLVRQEVQCHASHVKYWLKHYGLMRTWDNWVTLEREAHYLTRARSIFPAGDFRTLDKASAIIQADPNLKPLEKKKLVDTLILVQNHGMDALKTAHATNTVKKYLGQLEALNVNPMTIKDNLWGVDFIANPFYHLQAKGRAAV